MTWFRGAIHAHTNNSDGEGTLQQVADAYEALGYDFVFITDHNKVTLFDGVTTNLKLFHGCEVTLGAERLPVHVNALGVRQIEIPRHTGNIVETLEAAVRATRDAGGIAQFNHPNFHWALRGDHMRRVTGWSLLEVFNAHFECNNYGGGELQSPEQMWDELLNAGLRVWGSASDDMHHVTCARFSDYPSRALPGKAWVVVKAEENTLENVIEALKNGHFYSSTGVVLHDVRVSGGELSVAIRPESDHRYTTHFISEGRLVRVAEGETASCPLEGRYLRAKVFSSYGSVAWVQPAWRD